MAKSAKKKTTFIENITLHLGDIVNIEAIKVDTNFAERPSHVGKEFLTDVDISGSGAVKERELQAWTSDIPDSTTALEDSSHKIGKWDQFATNEKLFGLKTDFNEELYTTKLDKNSKDFKQREKEANKIAQEILKASSSNVHLAEERGEIIDLDEETLYGAVLRDGEESKAKKVRKSANPVEKVAKDFHEFSVQEKAILNQKKQEIIQKDRETKFNELKSFSQQLKEKQDSTKGKKLDVKVQQPVQSSKANENGARAANSTTPSSTATPSGTPTNPTAPDSSLSSPKDFKLNVNASSFTPNVSATPYVPSASPTYRKHPRPVYNLIDGATYFKNRKALKVSEFGKTFPKFGPPSQVLPLWQFGQKSYLYLFSAIAAVEDPYAQGYYYNYYQYQPPNQYYQPEEQYYYGGDQYSNDKNRRKQRGGYQDYRPE